MLTLRRRHRSLLLALAMGLGLASTSRAAHADPSSDALEKQFAVTLRLGPEDAGATAFVKPVVKPKPLRIASAPRLVTPAPSPPPKSSEPGVLTPPTTTWPIYGAGAIGLGGLTVAVILGGLTTNADHAVEVADGSLVRNGVTRARCAQPSAGTPFESACSTIRRNESASRTLGGAMTASLGVGLGGLAVAVGWYLFAPKDSGENARARVTPWVSASSGGAAFEGRF